LIFKFLHPEQSSCFDRDQTTPDQATNFKYAAGAATAKIDWERIDGEIAPLCNDQGRPGIALPARYRASAAPMNYPCLPSDLT
jgi:hypothetical protein